MPKVFITRPIPEKGIEMLKAKGYEVVTSPDDADGVISHLTDQIDTAFFDRAPKLKIVANYAAGFNNIDLEEAKRRNIVVTNTPDVLTDTVAEFTMALMLALVRRVAESDRSIRAGIFPAWDSTTFYGSDLHGKTLGIIGPGRIGSRVGELAKAFGMNVEMCGPDDDLDVVLARCDVVSLHVPLVDSTHHLINEARLKLMKPTAYLINTARGPVVDEAALALSLSKGTIRGAALDVFENEPNVHLDLLKLDNIVLTPHIASATLEARTKMAEVAATNIIECLEGRTPPNVVQ